jgi:hypothetical protein
LANTDLAQVSLPQGGSAAPARNLLNVALDDLAEVMKVAQKLATVGVGDSQSHRTTVQQFGRVS